MQEISWVSVQAIFQLIKLHCLLRRVIFYSGMFSAVFRIQKLIYGYENTNKIFLYQQIHEFDCSVNCIYMRLHTMLFNYVHDGSEKNTLNMIG